jgi:hypothetical protein
MWDFHRYWIYGLLVLMLASCVSCSMGGSKNANDLIETAGEAGCNIKSIKFDDSGKVKEIDCHDTVRYVR